MKTELRIRELCREQGITQADVAAKLGIRRDSFSQAISRNNFDLNYLRRIAAALDVPVWQLFIDPDELKQEDGALICPHCGKTIKIHIEKI